MLYNPLSFNKLQQVVILPKNVHYDPITSIFGVIKMEKKINVRWLYTQHTEAIVSVVLFNTFLLSFGYHKGEKIEREG